MLPPPAVLTTAKCHNANRVRAGEIPMSNYYYMDDNSGDFGDGQQMWEGRDYAFALCPKLDDRGERKYVLSCVTLQERERWKYALLNPWSQSRAGPKQLERPSAQNDADGDASLDEEWLQQQADGALREQ